MDVDMTAEQVLMTIQQLNAAGESLNKKKVKKSHPQLMRSALHYFPDWDHAIERSVM
ncbi:hypothetical protein [Halalkalibacter alkalisediminis]|uniref:Uncharacterized protein n=1 Tax=Halalkalibacter alkalisediminis TaxID=935616 RepID=A0ABV6NNR7_9BACI|nr:hypothetical protein [Halalkalibacter alkalisediminis]